MEVCCCDCCDRSAQMQTMICESVRVDDEACHFTSVTRYRYTGNTRYAETLSHDTRYEFQECVLGSRNK
jgi:hypothetical protein